AADPAAAATALAGVGHVLTTAQWIEAYNDEQQQISAHIMVALIGMAMVYTVIAMINAVVIAASDRRAEFAAARVTGLTRGQVVLAALAESLAVVAIGVLLGMVSATASIVGMAFAVRDLVGIAVASVPWAMFGSVVAIAVVVVGVTSVLTSLTATRTPAIRLVAARD
ncbi:FtsX-like permease family protein, partial [Asanoa iriomotensis]